MSNFFLSFQLKINIYIKKLLFCDTAYHYMIKQQPLLNLVGAKQMCKYSPINVWHSANHLEWTSHISLNIINIHYPNCIYNNLCATVSDRKQLCRIYSDFIFIAVTKYGLGLIIKLLRQKLYNDWHFWKVSVGI